MSTTDLQSRRRPRWTSTTNEGTFVRIPPPTMESTATIGGGTRCCTSCAAAHDNDDRATSTRRRSASTTTTTVVVPAPPPPPPPPLGFRRLHVVLVFGRGRCQPRARYAIPPPSSGETETRNRTDVGTASAVARALASRTRGFADLRPCYEMLLFEEEERRRERWRERGGQRATRHGRRGRGRGGERDGGTRKKKPSEGGAAYRAAGRGGANCGKLRDGGVGGNDYADDDGFGEDDDDDDDDDVGDRNDVRRHALIALLPRNGRVTNRDAQRARVRRREARRCWRRWDLTINMMWGERVGGGKTAKTTTEEGETLRGQRSGGNGGRGRTTAIIAGGEVVSSFAWMLRLTRQSFRICHTK